MRYLVCGARTYTDRAKIERILNSLLRLDPDMYLIEGRCPKGADLFAHDWGEANLAEDRHLKFPADWEKYGRAAGPKRNQQMLDEGKPDLVLAFGGLHGRGTNDMVRRSINAGVPVTEFDRHEQSED